MPSPAEIEARFWEALKSDMTIMIGLEGVEDAYPRPMTAQFERERGPIFMFTAKDNALVHGLRESGRALATFSSDGRDLFATLHGHLDVETNRAVIDRLWNPFVAAWFEKGKDDPKLALLRFEAEEAEFWLDDSSFLAGIKLLLGADPKREYKDKAAKVELR